MKKKKYLTAQQIAALYLVTPRTVRRWAADGMLPAPVVLSPRRYIYERGAVIAMLERNNRRVWPGKNKLVTE